MLFLSFCQSHQKCFSLFTSLFARVNFRALLKLSIGFLKSQIVVPFLWHGAVVKNLPADAGDTRDVGSVPGLGRSLGVGNGNPPPYSCLENSKDRRACLTPGHMVAKSQTDMTEHTHLLTQSWGHLKFLFQGKLVIEPILTLLDVYRSMGQF